MPHSVTIAATADALNQFVVRYGTKIHQKLKNGLEFERDLPKAPTENTYTGETIVVSSLVQPYQHAFTPNNTEAFDGVDSVIRPIKVDLQFTAEQLEKFFSKWRANWFDTDPEDIRSNYAGYVIGQHMLPQITEELNTISWAGAFASPTPGTPGALLTSVDGYKTNLATHISDGRITPINTGALVASTMVAQVRAFCAAIPEPYRYKTGILEMSKTWAQAYADDYQAKFPSRKVTEDMPDQLYLRVDHYNKTIIGRTCMEGSARIICRFPDLESMIVVTRVGKPDMFQFRFQVFDRTLKVMAEIYRAYNWETLLHCFVNEQV